VGLLLRCIRAGDGHTQQANVDAFARYAIVPRMLVAPTERDLSVSLFDMQLPTPLFMPPTGVVGVCSQDMHGDIAAAKASAQTGVPMMASTLTQDRMEDVRPHSADTPGLFQLYTANDKELAASFLRRAEQAGYKAVAVTLDTWITGWRPHDLNMANFPQLRGYCLQNYFTDEVFRARLSKPPEEDPRTAALEWAKVFGHPVRWEDLGWLRESTKSPMLLKGILHPDDVRKAREHGIDGIYCSNHGGRQANGGLPLSKLSQPSSKRLTACRCSSIRACALVPMSPRRWHWELPPSGWVARTSTPWLSVVSTVWCPNCGRCSQNWTCSWPSTASPALPTSGQRAHNASDHALADPCRRRMKTDPVSTPEF
jgi:hypothetical protein